MDHKHPFFWLANGYIIVGLLGGLGLGVMWGPHIDSLIRREDLNLTGLLGLSLIMASAILNGCLRLKCKTFNTQRNSELRDGPTNGDRSEVLDRLQC
jgi:hypothetical protein